jgi:hypothetical protein
MSIKLTQQVLNERKQKRLSKYILKLKIEFKKKNLELLEYNGKTVIYRCVCGKIIEKNRSNGIYKMPSCGCLFYQYNKGKENYLFKGYKEISARCWNGIEANAKKRNLEFNISIEDAYKLFEKQNSKCALTGENINFGDFRNKERTASLDRIDSSKGYVKENIQWVHKIVNKMKLNLTQQKFIKLCSLVIYPLKPEGFNLKPIKLKRQYNFTGYKNLTGEHWTRIKVGAHKRNIEFKLDIKDVYDKFEQQKGFCNITGLPIELENKYAGTASLDRINNTKGYCINNVQWIYKDINICLKQNLSEHDLHYWCKKVVEYDKNKKN